MQLEKCQQADSFPWKHFEDAEVVFDAVLFLLMYRKYAAMHDRNYNDMVLFSSIAVECNCVVVRCIRKLKTVLVSKNKHLFHPTEVISHRILQHWNCIYAKSSTIYLFSKQIFRISKLLFADHWKLINEFTLFSLDSIKTEWNRALWTVWIFD